MHEGVEEGEEKVEVKEVEELVKAVWKDVEKINTESRQLKRFVSIKSELVIICQLFFSSSLPFFCQYFVTTEYICSTLNS